MSITPDGPRGPAHKLQSGVLWLAALGKAPILPFHIEVDRQWRFGSWDGQKLPKPFSTIHVHIGEAETVTRDQLDQQPQETAERIEKAMMRNTNDARLAAGHETL